MSILDKFRIIYTLNALILLFTYQGHLICTNCKRTRNLQSIRKTGKLVMNGGLHVQ